MLGFLPIFSRSPFLAKPLSPIDTIPCFAALCWMPKSVMIAGISKTGTMMENMPRPHRQLLGTKPAEMKPSRGTVIRNGVESKTPQKARHCRGVRSATIMSLKRSSLCDR